MLKPYVEVELDAARSSVTTALIKLRRLVDDDELAEDVDRRVRIRGIITRLDYVSRELADA